MDYEYRNFNAVYYLRADRDRRAGVPGQHHYPGDQRDARAEEYPDKRCGAGNRADPVPDCSCDTVHLFADRNHVVLHRRIRDRGIYRLLGCHGRLGESRGDVGTDKI